MYDATITITDPYPDRETFQGPDPTLYGIDGIFTAGINTQLRKVLELETERDYHLLSCSQPEPDAKPCQAKWPTLDKRGMKEIA